VSRKLFVPINYETPQSASENLKLETVFKGGEHGFGEAVPFANIALIARVPG